jgi:hypothetical protein
MRLTIERDADEPAHVVARLSMGIDWQDQAAVIDPRVLPGSLVLDEWEIDFGDGTRSTFPVTAGTRGELDVPHVYGSGYFLVTATSRGSGQMRVSISLPFIPAGGGGYAPIAAICRVMVTVLVSDDTTPLSHRDP